MPGPTDLEQLMLEYINDARLDPYHNAGRYLTSADPLTFAGLASLGLTAPNDAVDIRQRIHLVKFGLNYRFGAGPVVANY